MLRISLVRKKKEPKEYQTRMAGGIDITQTSPWILSKQNRAFLRPGDLDAVINCSITHYSIREGEKGEKKRWHLSS